MESDMRRFSCFDAAALFAAAGIGFLAGERIHLQGPVVVQVSDASGELSEAPPTALVPPQPLDMIDLTCTPSAVAMAAQTVEPPLADTSGEGIHPVRYELPAGAPADPDILGTMPYLTDDPSPGLLPALGDVPLLPPVPETSPMPDPTNPIYQAALGFVREAAKMPEAPAAPNLRAQALANQSADERAAGADWRRLWLNDAQSTYQPVTDRVPIGTPPVSEHPSTAKPEKPKTPPPPKAETTEIRPGDLPSKPNGGGN
jgi:hypothetical protein